MRDLLDQRGFWVGRIRRRSGLGQTGNPPVALNDTLSVLRGQGPVPVPVLGNDIDPDGGALTLVSASAALGTASANADGTVTYAAPQGTPPGVVTFDTVVYEIADADGNRDTAQIDVTIIEPVLSVDTAPGNTLTITAAPEPISITVTEPAEFAGTYQADPLTLLTGPVALVPPGIQGSLQAGQTLTAKDGLWLHDLAAEPVTQIWQWQRDGVDVPGATGASYLLSNADIGTELTVTETRSDRYGARASVSIGVALGFRPSDDTALIGWWDADDGTSLGADANGDVASWADKAGGAPLTAPFTNREPKTGIRGRNGRNLLDFDGSRFLERAIALPASGDVAFHMVVEIDGTASAFEALISVEATNDFQIDANSGTAFDGRLNLAGVGSPLDLSGGPFAGAFILSVIFDRTGTATAEVFIGDASRGSTAYTAPLDASAALHVMTNRSENAWVDGAVGEVIVTADVTNRSDYHAYLAAKWGLV